LFFGLCGAVCAPKGGKKDEWITDRHHCFLCCGDNSAPYSAQAIEEIKEKQIF
jgi:hypothetical protein